jgi:hypothetical protein
MHLYAIVRGRQKLVRRFIENVEDLFLPWFKNKDGDTQFIQVVPREVKLFEIAFPEKYLPEILNTLEYKNGNELYNLQKSGLRKLLKLKKIPELKLNEYKKLGCRDGEKVLPKNVAVHLIGIKKDRYDENGIELL